MQAGHAIRLSASSHPLNPDIRLLRWGINFRSNTLAAKLAEYGIVPRKTYTLEVKGGVEFNRDFWRGAIDGDGHLGIHMQNQGPDAVVKLDGASEKFILQFQNFLKKSGVRGDQHIISSTTKGSLSTRSKFTLKLGVRAALDAVALLYTDCTQALSRKARKAAEMIVEGSERNLVGTVRTQWRDERAIAWARNYLKMHPTNAVVFSQDAIKRLRALPHDVVEKLPQSTLEILAPIYGTVVSSATTGDGVCACGR